MDWWSTVFGGVTALATGFSVFILFFYTYFTRKMQQAIEKQVNEQNRQTGEYIHQRRLGIMPSILLEVGENCLYAKNIGNGTALNVKFENTIHNEKLYSEGFRYKIENVLMLLIGEAKEINICNESDYKMPISWTGLRIAGVIAFQDIEGNSYQQILENLGETGKFRYGFPVLIEEKKEEKFVRQTV